jgi:hypothetical protein
MASDSAARAIAIDPERASGTSAIHEPQAGDLVVVRKPGATPAFGVLQHPSGVQFGASTRDAAIAMARSFAQTHNVDLWYDERDALKLLERYRPAAVPQS